MAKSIKDFAKKGDDKEKKVVDTKKEKEIKGANGVDFEPSLEEYAIENAIDFKDLIELFDGDLSDIDLYEHLITEIVEADQQDLAEGLNASQRIRKGNVMRRNKVRLQIARRRSLRRRATTKTIQKRAHRSAVSALKSRFTQGRAVGSLSVAEKNRVERIVKRRKVAVQRMSRKLVRTARATERKRLNNSFEMNVEVNALYEMLFLEDSNGIV